MSQYALVEKQNHLAVHALFGSKSRGEWFLENTVPEYVAKGYYMDKTLRPESFEIIPHKRERIK